jgi:hypothetical protein
MKLQNKFTITAHRAGDLMVGDDSKLSVTTKKLALEWVRAQPEYYGQRKRSIYSKYFDKGIECEPEAIDFAANYYDWGVVSKNAQRRQDEYMQGEPDIVLPEMIVDIKNSWDETTFPLFERELPDPKYYWQLQVYMNLWNKRRGAVVYTLMNAPERLIEAEARKEQYRLGLDDLTDELYQEFYQKMTFDDLRPQLRIKRFNVALSPYDLDRLRNRVEMVRAHIHGLPDDFIDEEIF